jgi:hypothetical protein
MKRIPKILQLPIIINWSRPSFFELQRLQKLDLLFTNIAA